MMRPALLLFLAVASLWAADDQPTFKSEVAYSRIDARVIDRNGQTVTGLRAKDFVLTVGAKPVPIKNFANENTPIDILLLLDVSGSMDVHVERIAAASQQALSVLGEEDRMAIMVFDTRTRVRLPFKSSHDEIAGELRHIVRSERFNGGTRITSAMLDAAQYVRRNARPDARRAVVILTDDETQDRADETQVEGSLQEAGAVLSFLQAPYDPQTWNRGPGGGGGGRPRGPWGSSGPSIGFPGGGGGWPGGGGGWPGGGGGRMPSGGGPGWNMDASHSAGTDTIARDTGGDTIPVSDAAALEDTLARLRQRYALYFYLPEGIKDGPGVVKVSLADQASIRYHDSEVQARRVFLAGGNGYTPAEPVVTTKVNSLPPEPRSASSTVDSTESDGGSTRHKGRAVNENSGPVVDSVGPADQDATPAAPPSSSTSPAVTSPSVPAANSSGHGWPRAPKSNP